MRKNSSGFSECLPRGARKLVFSLFEMGSIPLPRVATMHVSAFVYGDVGPAANSIPETALNNAMEALEAALAIDDFARQTCTLGGLVYSVRIEGTTIKVSGDTNPTGQCFAAVPLTIVVP